MRNPSGSEGLVLANAIGRKSGPGCAVEDNVAAEKSEARLLAEDALSRLRDIPYDQLVSRYHGSPEYRAEVGPSGTEYQVEVQAFWDDREGGNLRVIVSIDDGGWRSLRTTLHRHHRCT